MIFTEGSFMEHISSYRGDLPAIFISYAHRDGDLVMPILARMQEDGYRVWFDEGIDPGTEWDETIAKSLRGCGYFLAFVSRNYLASDNCKDELNFARDLGKKQLLVYLEEVSLPDGMAMRMNRLQAVHKYAYLDENEFFEHLYRAEGLDDFGDGPPRSAPGGTGTTVGDTPRRSAHSTTGAFLFGHGAAHSVGGSAPSATTRSARPAAPSANISPAIGGASIGRARPEPTVSAETATEKDERGIGAWVFTGIFGAAFLTLGLFYSYFAALDLFYAWLFGMLGLTVVLRLVMATLPRFPRRYHVLPLAVGGSVCLGVVWPLHIHANGGSAWYVPLFLAAFIGLCYLIWRFGLARDDNDMFLGACVVLAGVLLIVVIVAKVVRGYQTAEFLTEGSALLLRNVLLGFWVLVKNLLLGLAQCVMLLLGGGYWWHGLYESLFLGGPLCNTLFYFLVALLFAGVIISEKKVPNFD